MTNTRYSRSDVAASGGSAGTAPRRTRWTGLIAFAAFMMMMLGLFQAIEGITALGNSDIFKVRSDQLAVHVSYTVWGWTHLLLGVVILVSGIGVLSGSALARGVGVVVAAVSVVVNMVFLTAAPVMAMAVVLVDVVVMYALIVHGREMELGPETEG